MKTSEITALGLSRDRQHFPFRSTARISPARLFSHPTGFLRRAEIFVILPYALLLWLVCILLTPLRTSLTCCSLTCKRRKLKCDESKPTCHKCFKSSRDCVYGEQSVFRSQEFDSSPDRKRRRTGTQREVQAVSREETTWVDLPSERKFYSTVYFDILTPYSHVCSGGGSLGR